MKKTLLIAFVCCISQIVFAQTDIWTWINGDSIYGAPGNYGTQGVSSPFNQPMGREMAANWKDNAGNMWIYGGYSNDFGGGGYYLSDLWKYDPTINIWTWMKGDSGFRHLPVYGTRGVADFYNTPGDRKDPAYWRDNSGNLWMYAGNGCASNGCAAPTNDLWKYDIATNQWTFVSGDTLVWQNGYLGTQGVPAANNLPASRTGPQGWCDGAGNFWIFSGSSSYPGLWPTSDMWRFNPATNQWTWMKGDPMGQAPPHYGVKGVAAAANVPPARSNACTWTDLSGNLWMYGGSSLSKYYSDLWMFNPSANQWTWVSGDSSTSQPVVYGIQGVASAANTPGGGREGASWWRDDAAGDLWLFGGFNHPPSGNGRNFKDVWRYSLTSNMWTWMGGDTTAGIPLYNTMGVASYSNVIGTRNKAAAWVDNASGNLYVSGGKDQWIGVYLNDVWTYVPFIPFPIALPLHLLTFTAKRANASNLLNWTTAQEVNTDRFDIERSPNGREFSKIGTVKANSINGQYSYTDNNPTTTPNTKPQTIFYRLKMLDKDGQFTYSPIRQININHSTFNIALFPNPAKDNLQVQIESDKKATMQLQVLAQDGKVVLSKQVTVQQGSSLQSLNISQLSTGHYFLNTLSADKEPVVAGFEKVR